MADLASTLTDVSGPVFAAWKGTSVGLRKVGGVMIWYFLEVEVLRVESEDCQEIATGLSTRVILDRDFVGRAAWTGQRKHSKVSFEGSEAGSYDAAAVMAAVILWEIGQT